MEMVIQTFSGNEHRKHILKLISSEVRSPQKLNNNVITLNIINDFNKNMLTEQTHSRKSCMKIIRKYPKTLPTPTITFSPLLSLSPMVPCPLSCPLFPCSGHPKDLTWQSEKNKNHTFYTFY